MSSSDEWKCKILWLDWLGLIRQSVAQDSLTQCWQADKWFGNRPRNTSAVAMNWWPVIVNDGFLMSSY